MTLSGGSTSACLTLNELIVLRLPGWAESRGVKEEIAEARKRGIPITYMTIGMAEGEAA